MLWPVKEYYPKQNYNSSMQYKLPMVQMKLYLIGRFLMKEGRYSEALEVFTGRLADFRDCKTLAEQCRQELAKAAAVEAPPEPLTDTKPAPPEPATHRPGIMSLIISIAGPLFFMWLIAKMFGGLR